MAFAKFPPVTTGEAITLLKQDTMLLHDIVHGDDTATVLTENGVVPSIDKVIKDLTTRVDSAIQDTGWFIVGTFAAGFTFTSYNQVGRDASGELWSYNGDLPFVVNPLTVPSSPLYTQRGDAALRAELGAVNSTVPIAGVPAKDIAIHVKQSRRNISHYISRTQLDDALSGNPQLDTTAGWNAALQDTAITALDFKGGYKVSGTGGACITQTANVSLLGNSRRDTFIRADSAGNFTTIIDLQIATNGGFGDVRGWQAKNFNIFHNGGNGSCITNTAGLPMLECLFSNIGFQAGGGVGARDLVITKFAFSKVEQCSFGSGITCGLLSQPAPDGNKFLLNNFFGTPTSLIIEMEDGAYRTEVYGGTMVSRDGGVRIVRGSQIAIRGVQFEQFLPYGINQSPESAHITIVGDAASYCDAIIIEANNFGGGTNLERLIHVNYGSNVDITKNVMNAPSPTGQDVLITANGKYVKPRLDNVVKGNISNPRPLNNRFPMVVSDSGVGTYNVLKPQPSLGGAWLGGQFYKNENDEVVIDTGFNAGSIAPNSVLCTLPVGFRPADFYTLPAVSDAGFAAVLANPNGELKVGVSAGASNSNFASNLRFSSKRI